MISALIVDDDQRKLDAVSELLRSLGLRVENITVVKDAAAARRALQEHYYDILLLDVLLPARSGARPSGDVSVDLLRQIIEDGTTPAPTHILGITADPTALENHETD